MGALENKIVICVDISRQYFSSKIILIGKYVAMLWASEGGGGYFFEVMYLFAVFFVVDCCLRATDCRHASSLHEEDTNTQQSDSEELK